MKVEELIGDNVRERRESVGMTQKALGDAVGEYLGKGWTRQAVSAAEAGKRDWRSVELVAVARVLEVSPGWLCSPKINDVLEFPAKAVPFDDMVTTYITKDTAPLDAAAEVLETLRRQMVDIEKNVNAAGSKVVLVAHMLQRENRRSSK